MELGESRPTFYFDVHGEANTDKTIELTRERADELGVEKGEVFDYRLIERRHESMECLKTPQRIISCLSSFS
jgi:hypothetical protein